MIIAIAIICCIVCSGLVWFVLAKSFFKRLDNADSRIVRLENAMDNIMAGKAAMAQPENIVKLRCKPDEKCPLCFGRGHIGKNTETGLHIVCKCCA